MPSAYRCFLSRSRYLLICVGLLNLLQLVPMPQAIAEPFAWGPNLRVNHGGDDVYHDAPQVAIGPEGVIYVVWEDWRHTTGSVYITRSTDGGLSFEVERRIDPAEPSGGQLLLVQWPCVAVDGRGDVYVAWVSWLYGETGRVYCACSSDQGQSFAEQRLVSDSPLNDRAWPAIAGNPHRGAYLVWGDFRNGEEIIDLYTSCTENGFTFSENVKANQTSVGPACTAPWPRIVAGNEPDLVHIVWRQTIGWNSRWIYACRSTDGGASFAECDLREVLFDTSTKFAGAKLAEAQLPAGLDLRGQSLAGCDF